MKKALHLPNRHYYCLSIIFFVVLFLLISCKKNDTDNGKVVRGEAKVKLINAAQSPSSVDFYLNDSKINSSALAFGETSDYIKIESGTKTTTVSKDVNTLDAEAEFSYVPTLSYTTFFVEDKTGKGEVLIFEDNLGAIEMGKARIKFINLSPNFTNAINITLAGVGLLVNSLPFKEASGYFTIAPNTNIGISVLGLEGLKIIEGSEFEAGKIYTLWVSGSSNSNLSINKITYN